MHKQYTAYRVTSDETHNATGRPLKAPSSYDTTCEHWDDRAGTGSDPFFSSDATEIEEAADIAADFDTEETMDTSKPQTDGGSTRANETGRRQQQLRA
ncbi:hypothetical protein ON010_g7084 [Phytophthora cinnamomi]|nr:hypothetical protein ON010_g7084 [Phytophthora cinnamomi]